MSLQDRTEAPTPFRRDEARKEGKVAKSNDVTSAIVLLVTLFIIKSSGPFLIDGMKSLMADSLGHMHPSDLTLDSLKGMFCFYGMKFGILCSPVLAASLVVGIAANIMQVGFIVSIKSIAPDLKKIDPIKGMARLFSPKSAVELLKSILKVSVVAYFVYAFLKTEYPMFIDLAGQPIDGSWQKIADLCWRMMMRACVAMLIIGILDYVYQRYSFEKTLKMTKQEVKDDHKRSEGDPQIKGAIRRRQMEAARRRMIHDVAKADVVITNPTRIAIAIKYDPETMAAPVVLAKGQRLLAQRIKELASANGVPIVENKPVARLLYKVAEVGQAIPEDLYQAVAEILAYVYQLGEKAGRRRQK